MTIAHTTSVRVAGAVFAVLLLLLPSVSAARHTDNTYPKRANFFLSLEFSREDALSLARWDLVVLNMEQQELHPDLIALMRKQNPHIRIFAHVSSQEIVRHPERSIHSQPLRHRLSQGIAPEWYLRSVSGERLSWWPNTYLLNVTNRAPVIGAQQWHSYLASFVVNEMLSTGLWDGIFFDNTWDNITHFAGNNIDLNLDGVVDADADVAWRAGMTALFSHVRERFPEYVLLIGNNDTTQYTEQLNGMLLENFHGERWVHLMNRYAFNVRERKNTRINIINANTKNTGVRDDYQAMRFGYTSSLLEDGYYSFDFGDQHHGQLWWYDEYDAYIGAPRGNATSSQALSTYQPDVWQRPYDRGLVVVNSTDQPKEISLPTDYEKLAGTQDPKVNDGSIVRSVTVDGQDGVVLLKLLSTLDAVSFHNGTFARFLRADGSRVRNGFFLFEDDRRGGDTILRADLDGNGKNETIVASGPRLFAWRDDGQLYMRVFPYTPQFRGTMHIAVGDVTGDTEPEVIVSANDGYSAPVKIYTRNGELVGAPWYPFGAQYTRGIHIIMADVDQQAGLEFIIGSQDGNRPLVGIYSNAFTLLRSWHPFARGVTGLPSVAVGDVRERGTPSIIVGSGQGAIPRIRMFSAAGVVEGDDVLPFQTQARTGIRVGATDVDYDGQDDIVAMSQHLGS